MSFRSQIDYMEQRGASGRPLIRFFRNLVFDREPPLVGDGLTDNTKVFKEMASRVQNGGSVFIPSGKYLISETIDWGSGRVIGAGPGGLEGGTTIKIKTPGIGFQISGSYGEISNIHLDGGFVAAVGILVLLSHKPIVNRCTAEGFVWAGFAFSGAQNMLVNDCFAKFCLYNFFICNNTRNIQFINCNATDFPTSGSTWMEESAPDCRAVRIGQVANEYIPQLDGNVFTNTPSRIMFRGGILERFNRHDYIVEITHAYDNIVFDDVEFTLAKTAYLHIEAPALADLVLTDPVFRSSNVPLVSNPDSRDVFVTRPISGGGAPVWQVV